MIVHIQTTLRPRNSGGVSLCYSLGSWLATLGYLASAGQTEEGDSQTRARFDQVAQVQNLINKVAYAQFKSIETYVLDCFVVLPALTINSLLSFYPWP